MINVQGMTINTRGMAINLFYVTLMNFLPYSTIKCYLVHLIPGNNKEHAMRILIYKENVTGRGSQYFQFS